MKNAFKYIIFSLTLILYTSLSYATDCVFYLHGTCFDCNSSYALPMGTKDNCEAKCPNRIYIFADRTCRLKFGQTQEFSLPANRNTDIRNCTLKNGEQNKANKKTVEKYFFGADGECYPCDTKGPVRIVKGNCQNERFCNQNCTQRIQKHYNSADNLFSVLACPSNKPLMDRFMMPIV